MANIAQQQMDIIDITDDDPGILNTRGSLNRKSLTVRHIRPKVAKGSTSPAQAISSTTAITIPHDDNAHIEKRCENPDCSAPTLISLVPTRPTPQFIHDPAVVPEPILVNGYTTVFEVGGCTAKVSELSTVKGPDGKVHYKSNKPLYRIVPNTHAHIVNYVIVDAEGETLRKIKQNDPSTVKKLLESQKNSAEQLLEKLIGGRKNDLPIQTTSRSPVTPRTPAVQMTRSVLKPNLTTCTSTSTSVSMPASAQTITTPIIASVSSGVAQVVAIAGPSPVSVPVSAPAQVPVSGTISAVAPIQTIPAANALEKMQSELRELRETVKLLTEHKGIATGSSDDIEPKKRKIS